MEKILQKKKGGARSNFAYTIQIVQILEHILAMMVSILVLICWSFIDFEKMGGKWKLSSRFTSL